MATASTTSFLLAPPRSSSHLAGRPTPTPSPKNSPGCLPAPAPTIRPRRRFAAARCEASLFPAWQLRAPARRRNTLREKAASPPLVELQHQVPPPDHEALDSRNRLNQDRPLVSGTGEPLSASSNDPASLPDLDDKLENFDCLDAGPSGNVVVAESNMDGEKGLDWDAEEGHFCGAVGTGPVFSVYKDADGTMVRVEVNEDELVSRCVTADGEGSSDLQSILSRARVMAEEFGSGSREVPRNSSLVRFVATEKKKSQIVNAEVSVVQTNGASLRAVAWSGFATVCGISAVFIASKLIWRNVKVHLSEKVRRTPLHGMKAGQLDKGNIKVVSNLHMFPGDLLGRPQLERRELMNNLKKAKDSREWFSFRNMFSCNTVASDDYASRSITKVRRMATDVNTLDEGSLGQRNAGKSSSVVFPQSLVTVEEEISGSQSVYLDELRDINFSDDIINGNVEQSMDVKDVAPTIDIIARNQYNVGEIEQPEPKYNDESTTDANDRASVLYATEKEADIYSADDHNAGPNGIDTLSAEFERKEQFTEIGVIIQGLKPSVPFSSDKQMVSKNVNAHQISNSVVPETADDFSPSCFNIASSKLKYNGAYLSNSENDINCVQEIEAPTTFANDAQTTNCEDFAHCVSIVSEEACKNLVMTDISTMKSTQRINEEPVDLMADNMQSMQEPEPSNHDGKQIIYANVKDRKIDVVHYEIKTSSEIYSTGTLDKACTSPLYALQEETVQHKGAKVSIPEKQEKITSSNKEARAYLQKDKGKLQKEMWSVEVPETKLLTGVPATSAVVGPSNGVQKTKRVAHKRQKKVQSNQGVAEHDIVQDSSMFDQESSSQNVKRTRKYQTNGLHTQESQARDEIPETALVASLPGDAPKSENMKPLGETDLSAGASSSKDTMDLQPSRLIAHMMMKEELKLDSETSERVEAAAPETKTNMHGYNVMHERSTVVNKSKKKMGAAAAKKSTKRKSLAKRTKSSNPVSNKDSGELAGD